jgi:hypothetical protein
MNVKDFIAAEVEKPFRWGETDCVSTAARWVQIHAGIDLLPAVGTYSTAEEAERALSELGGLAVAVNRVMRKAGFQKAEAPQPGDIGLVVHAGKLCLAVHGGGFWFSHDEAGLIGAPLSAVWKAWSI